MELGCLKIQAVHVRRTGRVYLILWRQMRNGNNRFYDLHDNRAMRNDDTLKTERRKQYRTEGGTNDKK